ncbi:hypothetical protein ABPG75_008188, partial [Micractinium tetrahymenae]
ATQALLLAGPSVASPQQLTADAAASSALLHELSSSLRAAALLSRRPPPAAEAPLGSSEVLAEYASSLQRLAQNEAAAANPSTSAAAAAVSSEFCSWLAARSLARRITLQTCTPEDVAVFFESHWLPKHCSSLLEDGAVHAAPSYLASTVSHLRGFFKRLGRDGQFSHATQTGNPCCDDLITKLTSTYHQQCWQQGYVEKSAKSLTFEQYDELTAGLHRETCSVFVVHQWVGLPTNSYLVRPLADDHLSFKAGPLTTSAFNKQL